MTRWVIYASRLDEVDPDPLLDHLAEDVAKVMREIVPVDTGATKEQIYVVPAYNGKVRIVSPRVAETVLKSGRVVKDDPKVPIYLERGTSRMRAQPYMRPALYRYRPGHGQTVMARP